MSKNLRSRLVTKRTFYKPVILFFFVFTVSSVYFSQDSLVKSIVHRVESGISLTRFDVFHTLDYSFSKQRFQAGAGIGYGIIRTYFQQRCFPKISAQGSYLLIKKPKFSFGPRISYNISWLRLNRSSKYFNNWNEVFGGLHFEVGKKWIFGSTLAAGYFSESYFSQLENSRSRASNWAYLINFSLIHEL